MGNYLKIAADRASGRDVQAIHPRLPSLFEPLALPVSAHFTRFANPIQSEHQPPPFVPEPIVEPAREKTPGLRPLLQTEVGASREVSSIGTPAKPGSSEHSQSKATPTFPPQQKKLSIEPSVYDLNHHEETQAPATRTTQGPETKASLHIEPKHHIPPERPEVRQEVQEKTIERHGERSVVKEIVERVLGVPAAARPLQPESYAGPIRPVAASQQATLSLSGPPEDSRPVINVVIGRVSVNAITERPVPAKSAQPPRPILSLDRYLEQRRRAHE